MWRPDEIGLLRTLLLSAAVVAVMVGGLATVLAPPDPPERPRPMTVRLTELPPPAPAELPYLTESAPEPALTPELAPALAPALAMQPPPDVVPQATAEPPPAPDPPLLVLPSRKTPGAPSVQPRPALLQSRTRRPSPLRAGSDVPAAPPATAAPLPVQQPVPERAPPTDTTSGIGPYRAGLHRQIERNLEAGAEAAGTTGTALVEAVIGPDGQVVSARIARTSGSRPLDQAALGAVRRGGYRPFGPHMPAGPITISVPITIVSN